MDDTLLGLLRRVDTPTVCNAVEVAQGKRGFDAFTRGTMPCSAPEEPAVLGSAIGEMRETEALVLEAARGPVFDFAAFETAWTAFEKART